MGTLKKKKIGNLGNPRLRYDYSDRKVDFSLAEEAFIRTEYIVSELERS